MKKINFANLCLPVILTICCLATMHAQTGEGGVPPSFRFANTVLGGARKNDIPITFNVKDLRLVDDWQTERLGAPMTVGTIIDVNYNPDNSGEWLTLESGERVWQMTVRAAGAIALMLYYSDFYIPQDGKLFIYNAEKTQILGAYTTQTNPRGGRFATELVAGDELTLEYIAPPSGELLRLAIEGIGYGYNNITVRNGQIELRAASCEVNVNCEEGDAWQNQKKSVCRMLQRIGQKTYLCSASLVNNTAQDLKPYILSAYHCSLGEKSMQATAADMTQWTFYFHYENSVCNSSAQPVNQKTMVGCRKMAATSIEGESDGLLVLLNEPIPKDYNVYYNGWDIRDTPAKSGVSIHFPSGSYASISTFTSPVINFTFESDDGMVGGAHAHWNAIFEATTNGHGITESGSSGAPLFNENKLVVGTLTGGSSYCNNPYRYNLYGKFAYHWNKYKGSDSTRMDVWLDPLRSGVQTLAGRFHEGVLPAPRNINAVYANKKVQLTWTLPSGSKYPQYYYIYDNNLRIGRTDKFLHEQLSPVPGDHVYCVTAVYDNDNESPPISKSIVIPEYKTPGEVTAVLTTANQIAVTWKPPVYEQSIYWGSKYVDAQIVMDDDEQGRPKPFYFGQMWDEQDILPFHRRTLAAVKFMPVRNNTYEIYIRQGARTYRQHVGASSYAEMNTIALTTPFVIDGNKPLIVSLFVENPLGYPAYCDAGPAVRGKGDIYSYDGEIWESLYDPEDVDGEFDVNFFLAAVVTSTEGDLPPTTYSDAPAVTVLPRRSQPAKMQASLIADGDPTVIYSLQPSAFPTINGYNIYRNGVKISAASASVRRYVDTEAIKIASYYQVSAIYEAGAESELSTKSDEIQPQSIDAIDAGIALRPGVFVNQVELTGAYVIEKVEIYTADGQLRMRLDRPQGRTIDTHLLPTGVCLFRIYTADGSSFVLKGLKSDK